MKIHAPHPMYFHSEGLKIAKGENEVDVAKLSPGTHRHLARLVEHGVFTLPDGGKMPAPPPPETGPGRPVATAADELRAAGHEDVARREFPDEHAPPHAPSEHAPADASVSRPPPARRPVR